MSEIQIGEAWRKLSEEEKHSWHVKAGRAQQQREVWAQKLLSEPDDQGECPAVDTSECLSRGQKKRLQGSRLNRTLQQVANHSAWKSGLGLSDHVSPLKPEFVLDAQEAEIDDKIRVMNFNPLAVPNPAKTPVYKKPCALLYGGLCHRAPHFRYVGQMVGQLHEHLQLFKMDTAEQVVLFNFRPSIELSADDVSVPLSSTWGLLGIVAKKPIGHVFLQFVPFAHERLHVMVRDGMPRITTSHLMFNQMCAEAGNAGWEASKLRVCAAWL